MLSVTSVISVISVSVLLLEDLSQLMADFTREMISVLGTDD